MVIRYLFWLHLFHIIPLLLSDLDNIISNLDRNNLIPYIFCTRTIDADKLNFSWSNSSVKFYFKLVKNTEINQDVSLMDRTIRIGVGGTNLTFTTESQTFGHSCVYEIFTDFTPLGNHSINITFDEHNIGVIYSHNGAIFNELYKPFHLENCKFTNLTFDNEDCGGAVNFELVGRISGHGEYGTLCEVLPPDTNKSALKKMYNNGEYVLANLNEIRRFIKRNQTSKKDENLTYEKKDNQIKRIKGNSGLITSFTIIEKISRFFSTFKNVLMNPTNSYLIVIVLPAVILGGIHMGKLVGIDIVILFGILFGIDIGILVGLLAEIHVGIHIVILVGIYFGIRIVILFGIFVLIHIRVLVGLFVGLFVGILFGILVGIHMGILVEIHIGIRVGIFVGMAFGILVGIHTAIYLGKICGKNLVLICMMLYWETYKGILVRIHHGILLGILFGINIAIHIGVFVEFVGLFVGIKIGIHIGHFVGLLFYYLWKILDWSNTVNTDVYVEDKPQRDKE